MRKLLRKKFDASKEEDSDEEGEAVSGLNILKETRIQEKEGTEKRFDLFKKTDNQCMEGEEGDALKWKGKKGRTVV